MKSEITGIARYYSCLKEDCPHTCCRGFSIPVDEETMERIGKEPGRLGEKLRRHISGGEGSGRIKKVLGACPFLGKDCLCSLQSQGRDDLMPLICVQFPRQVMEYADRREVTLLLSCYAAAQAFCAHPEEVALEPGGEELSPYITIENKDDQLLSLLLKIRGQMLEAIADPSHSLPEVFEAVYRYAKDTNLLYLSNGTREEAFDEELGFLPEEGSYAFFPIGLMDTCILDLIDYSFLALRNRRLSGMIRRYKRIFGEMYEGEADLQFSKKVGELIDKAPDLEKRYRWYFYYTLVCLFPYSYESCFWQRQTLLAIFYTELLMIFDVTEYIVSGEAPDQRAQADIISSLERGSRHNPSLTANIYNLIRTRFL